MGTFAASGAVVDKAGSNVSTAIPETAFNDWIEQAEAETSLFSRFDWVASSAAITTVGTRVLNDAVSTLAAISAVKYDMAGYTSRIEAEDVINVLRDSALRKLQLIRDQKGVKFLRDGA